MGFGERMRIARRQREITQVELARLLGVSQGTITGWETNQHEPSHKFTVALARALGVSTDYLLGHEGGDVPPTDIAAAIDGLVETVENGGALVDGDALAPAAADVAAPMLKGTLAATRSAQREAVKKGGGEHGR